MKLLGKKYRINLRRVLPVVMVPGLAVLLLVHKPVTVMPFSITDSNVADLLPQANSPAQGSIHILRDRAGHPEILGIEGTPEHPSQVLADARLGTLPPNIYRIRLNWRNGVPNAVLPLQDLSLNQSSSDEGLTMVPPYIVAYFSALNNQIQSLNLLNTNDNTQKTFAFTGDVQSASLISVSRQSAEVRFLEGGSDWQTATLAISGNSVVSSSPMLVEVSAAANNNAPFIQFVEAVRRYIGPGVVAFLENTWYGAADVITRYSYLITHGNSTRIPAAPAAGRGGIRQPGAVVSWQTVGPTVAGDPVLQEAILHPDPARPYATVHLVQVDPALVDLHLVAGTSEPKAVTGIHGTGRIPGDAAVQSRVIAAFNGGFKSSDGNFGVMVDHKTYLPPQNGLATVALYRDGKVALGSWGMEVTPSPDIVSYLQNLPLILDHGLINPDIDKPGDWGITVGNSTRIWRSGLGITGDGKLIYAAGYPVSAQGLAVALQTAGCRRGMQLDINSYWVTFNFLRWTVQNGRGYLVGTKLTSNMRRPADRYLVPDTRDFFYLTLKKGS